VTVENLQMLGNKDDATPTGGNNYSQQGGTSHETPAQQHNYSQPASSAPAATPRPASSIPEIDINEDEIPFRKGVA